MNLGSRIIIIGGGISGLAAAHRLAELSRQHGRPLQVTVLEARPRVGGVIETREQDGFVLEGGPDSFLTEKPWALRLCERLGLLEEVIPTDEAFRRSFIVRRGRLIAVPEQFYLLAPTSLRTLATNRLTSWPGKARMAAEWWIPPRRDEGDESLASFIRRRFGREALERIGQPMVSGIYSADANRLSLQATMPTFRQLERQYGSVLRGLRAQAATRRHHAALARASGPRYSLFASLRRGVSSLPARLVERMPEVTLRCGIVVERIERQARWRVRCHDGASLEAEAVCVAMPAPHAAALLQPVSEELARLLAGIAYESVATVNLAFRRAEIPHPLNGFGFVIPAIEGRRMVGCSFSSVKFAGRAPEGSVLVRGFVGGAMHRDVMGLDDAGLAALVREELRRTLGVSSSPLLASVHRHAAAMPQYHVGHLDRVAAIEQARAPHAGLFLTGNSYAGIGLPDCIHHAESAAERLFAALAPSSAT